MRVPVLPSPALQCTATTPPAEMTRSERSINSLVISSVGFVPSSKYTAKIVNTTTTGHRGRLTIDVLHPTVREMSLVIKLLVQPVSPSSVPSLAGHDQYSPHNNPDSSLLKLI
jgi:hypothetical protein